MRKILLSKLIPLVICACLLNVGSFFAVEPEFVEGVPQQERDRDGIPHFLKKVANREDIKVAYFGGSITAANGWRVQTLAKFNETYEGSTFSEINAAIGGTGSDLGVYRQGFDVLQHDPDLVFVEFCVNDGGTAPQQIWRQMEGIVRQIWKHNIETDIVFVYTYRLGHENDYLINKTPRSVSAMEQIAEFYGIPSLDFNVPVVQLHEQGKLTYKADKAEEGKLLFSTDGVHPLTGGHEVYTKVVCDAFEKMRVKDSNESFPSIELRKTKLKKTFISDNYENAKLVPIKESQLFGEWTTMPNDSPLNWMKERLGETVYMSNAPGSRLSFKFKGSNVAIYDVLGPNGGQVWVTIDGQKKGPIARFDSYCTYHRLATLVIGGGLDPNVVHEVTIEIDSEQPSRQPVAFRLENPEKELAEPKYQGHNVWFGPIMILGDVVE